MWSSTGGAVVADADDQPICAGADLCDLAGGDDFFDGAGSDIDGEKRVLADVVGGGVDPAAVSRPDDFMGRAVPFLGEHACFSGGPFLERDAQSVGLVAGAFHHQVGERFAVGREGRASDQCVLAVDDQLGLFFAGDGDDVDVVRGRPGFGDAGGGSGKDD